ncbi:hypothetical protein HYV79_01425 [Candidatus Woesearchaeota archaeon]|nr:hypothetical protein [Candidatus Woesearchaeota archaeon]
METMSKLKKAVALGMGLSMVGATLFGASAAKLSSYPEPFVVGGVPAANLAVVVGADAKGTDTAGAMDIIQGLQQAAVVETPVPGGQAKVRLTGAAVEFGTPTDLLEIDETLGAVRDTFSEFDLDVLKGGSLSTQRGVTKYNQYLQFPKLSTYSSNRVVFSEDQNQNVGDFLFFRDNNEVVTWVLQFEEGLTSDLDTNGQLTDLDDRHLNVLGTDFTVVGTLVKGNSTNPGRAELLLLGGPAYLTLGEGDKQTVSLDGKEHTVEVVVISETNNEVILKVDGQTLPRMKVGELEPSSDGTLVGVEDIVPTGKDTQSSLVGVYLGAKKMRLLDNQWNDSSFTVAGLEVNNEVVESDDVLISLAADGAQDVVQSQRNLLTRAKIERVAVNISADGLVGDVYVPAGHSLSEYLDEPEALVVNSWDLRYEGLGDTGTTTLKVQSSGRGEYNMRCVNQEGLEYTFPLATVDPPTTGLFAGDFVSNENRELVWQECSHSVANRNVAVRDFFILTNLDGSELVRSGPVDQHCFRSTCNDDSAFSAVYEYVSYDATNKVMKWQDLAAGTLQFVLGSTATNVGRAVSHGTTFQVNGDEATLDTNISIDMDGDGTLCDSNSVPLLCEGGLIVNFCSNTTSNGITGTANALTNNALNMTLQVCNDNFDTAPGSANTTILLSVREASAANNIIGLARGDVLNVSLKNLRNEPEIFQALTKYGQLVELFDPATSDVPEELTVVHPLSQRGAQVFLTGGTTQRTTVGGQTSQRVQELGVGVAKLDSEVKNVQDWNAVVVGGPCANSAAAALLGNPEDCTEGFAPGKAKLKLLEHPNGNVALLVAGYSGQDTRAASRALLTGQVANVDGAEAELIVTSLSDVRVRAV